MYLAFKFCKAGELAVDTCTSDLASIMASFQLSEHRRFAAYEKDSAFFPNAQPSHLKVYAMRVLNQDSDSCERRSV